MHKHLSILMNVHLEQENSMKILVTGGTGFIGSHTCVALLESGYEVVIIDNLSNSSSDVVEKIERIANQKVTFYEGDVLDEALLTKIFETHAIDAVIHFAGYKAVGESVKYPLKYYHNNLQTTVSLAKVMQAFHVNRFVFSSSATVYGNPKSNPIDESFALHTTNPYGTTKLFCEQILEDVVNASSHFSVVALRYFNPIGAHPSGLIGENPKDIPNNLMPFIMKVANKELAELQVFGNDYDTVDGTGIRDYIHVMDLAQGHIKAVEFLLKNTGYHTFNLGTGNGYSVLQVVETFKQVNQIDVPYQIVARRPGDIATCYANTTKANQQLNWKATKTLTEMCQDAWHFIVRNQ